METKEINIEWQGKEEIVRIKRLGWFSRDEIFRQASDIKVIGGEQVATINMVTYKLLTLLKGIESAPFKVTKDVIICDDYPAEVFDKLFEEIKIYNSISPLEQPNTTEH